MDVGWFPRVEGQASGLGMNFPQMHGLESFLAWWKAPPVRIALSISPLCWSHPGPQVRFSRCIVPGSLLCSTAPGCAGLSLYEYTCSSWASHLTPWLLWVCPGIARKSAFLMLLKESTVRPKQIIEEGESRSDPPWSVRQLMGKERHLPPGEWRELHPWNLHSQRRESTLTQCSRTSTHIPGYACPSIIRQDVRVCY